MTLSNFESMDPILLFSLVNTKLRDDFEGDLDRLVSTYEINKTALLEKLAAAGFEYLETVGQFR